LKAHKGSKRGLWKKTKVSLTVLIVIDIVPSRHFRKPMHIPLELTSVGLGTFIGAPDDQTDFDVYNAVKLLALSGGINLFDTAINFRCQKAERTIGAAVKTLIKKYGIGRDELFICTKNGYIPDDADSGVPAATLI
jgi:aryl-alcohol dehydrogenase-like predicted oxidoreductase